MRFTLFPCFLSAACVLTADSDPAPVSCPTGEILDGSTCVPEACGVGTWGSLPADGNTVYVDVTANPDGDGSESAPFTSIQAGVDLAGDRDGGLVAVAAGAYAEVIAMGSKHDGVSLAGRCKELVTVDGGGGEDAAAIEIIGEVRVPTIGIAGVTVTGGTYGGIWVEAAAVAVRDSDLRSNEVIGLFVTEGTATIEEVLVYGTMPNAGGLFGRGINAQVNAIVTATGCTIQENTEMGVYAADAGTTVALVDTAVLDTSAAPDGTGGRGISVSDGASLTASGCTIQGNEEVGVIAYDAGTEVELVDTAILEAPTTREVGGSASRAKRRSPQPGAPSRATPSVVCTRRAPRRPSALSTRTSWTPPRARTGWRAAASRP